MQERRNTPRLRVFKSAKLVVGTSSVLDCTVRNLTSVGARIEVPNSFTLPERIDIIFDGGRTLRRCRLIWRGVNETGVQFI